MHNINRIGIWVLVAIFFTTGYTARMHLTAQEQKAAGAYSRADILGPGNKVASADIDGAANIDFRPIETLYSVVKNLREHYVEHLTPADEGNMTHDALRAMLGALKDPNTRFIDSATRRVIEDENQGTFHGIGASLGIRSVKTVKP